MEKRTLGHTGIEVSRLCFGSLTMTKMQRNLSIEEGAALLVDAYKKGVNFVDTAQYYENYAYIRKALETIPREDYIIATKSYAYDTITAKAAFEEALEQLGTDYIDLFLLHEQESEHTLRGHEEALLYFAEQKKAGKIRALGLSTHFVAGVLGGINHPLIEVIHPIYNEKGIGIADGTREMMDSAIEKAKAAGIGIYGMKALGGGHLIPTARESISFVLVNPNIDAVAIGMQSVDEIDANIALFSGEPREDLHDRLRKQPRNLSIDDYCIGCGNCEKRCNHNAIHVIDGQAVVNENCILCGYCAFTCPEFCIKVI